MTSKHLVLVSLVLALSSISLLAADKYPRPKNLHCEAPRANAQANDFTISDFDTDHPGADNDASDSDGLTVDSTVTQLCANNGCDNSYCYVFFTGDVTALAQGKVKSISGLMNYLNSDSREGQELADTVTLTCTAGK